MQELPVQADRCAFTGNFHLGSHPDSHDIIALGDGHLQTGCAMDVSRVLEVVALVRLH